MSQTPVPDAPIRVHIGAKRLNGTVWGLLLLAALAVAVTSGSYAALIPLMFLLPITGVGLVANLVFFFCKMATGRFRQALATGWALCCWPCSFLGCTSI
jgi:hypothetical protein